MTKSTPENLVKSHIRRQLVSLGPQCKWHANAAGRYSVSGISDFSGVYAGMPFFIEAKASGGKPTSRQLAYLNGYAAVGAMSIVVRGVEEAQGLAAAMRAHRQWLTLPTLVG